VYRGRGAMDSFEVNKIATAVLSALLGVLLVYHGAKLVVHPKKLEKNVYEIAVEEETPKGGPPPAAVPIGVLLAKADPAAGQKSSSKCTSCHDFSEGGPNKIGPNLYGVLGREKGKHQGFTYSSAFGKLSGAWTYEDLDAYLKKPAAYAPGTKMSFAGLSKDEERANVIAYLRTLSKNPPPLPEAKQ
jgi:cytochrome c